MFVSHEEKTNNDVTVPLLDSDNLMVPLDLSMNNDSRTVPVDDQSYTRSSTQRSNNPSPRTTSITQHPLLSIVSIPITLLFHVLTNLQKYIYTNFIVSNNDGKDNVVEESEFLSTIPQEQDKMQDNIDHVKIHQHDLGRNIDDLTKRVQKLEERRRKRELAMEEFYKKEYAAKINNDVTPS